MKRSFPPPAREALSVLVASALLCSAACTPNHNVKPGAPQLIEFNIVQTGAPPTAVTITPGTPDCPSIGTGASCLPMGHMADAADGGAFDADVPPDSVCRLASANTWCRCYTDDPMVDPTKGTWNCDPLGSVIAVVAVFDRLLDTTPLDPGDAAALTDVVTAEDEAMTAIDLPADYSSTGNANGLIFNVFGPFFGNFRADGPSLMAAPQPIFRSGATVTVSLNPMKILAKDGTTPFEGSNLLMSGKVTFAMAPFSAVGVPPNPKAPNPNAATVALTNLADPPGCFTDGDPMTVDAPCAIEAHITATADGAPVAFHVATNDGATYSVTPAADVWPVGATIVITVDAAVQNLLGQPIDTAHSLTFTAP
jgi:hypothetical protein